MSELQVPGFGRLVLLCRDRIPRARGMAAYVRDGYWVKFGCGCCKILVFGVCGARPNVYVSSLHLNPDIDDRIYEWLLTAMAARKMFVPHSRMFVCD